MSSDSEAHVKRNGAAAQTATAPRRGRTGPHAAGTTAAAGWRRFPSFFLTFTLRFPGWRGAVPIIFPLFVLEDLLESTGYLMSAFFFLYPALTGKTQVSLPRTGWRGMRAAAAADARRSCTDGPRADAANRKVEHGPKRERYSVKFGPSWLFALADLVRALRYQGRFTLLEVSEGSSGIEISIRLV
ncbi:MAG: hypothetical protein QME92_09255 [Bacillota bacterium]|nr:hypothetical protein [Bacillota bacterium]